MFILVGEAYRTIETDHNPLLKEARKRAGESYEKGPSNESSFRSKRPEGKDRAFYDDEEGSHYDRVHDWHEEKFLRRYRWNHLHVDTSVPMSIRNVDRHGI